MSYGDLPQTDTPKQPNLANLFFAWLMRGMTGESTISESIQWSIETKVKIPRQQAVSIFGGILGIFAGLYIFGWQVVWLVDIELTAGDYMLVGSILMLLFCGTYGIAKKVSKTFNTVVTAMLAVVIGMVIIVGFIASGLAVKEKFEIVNAGALGLAVALIMACSALTYSQLTDLIDRFGQTSPMERLLLPGFLEYLRGQQLTITELDEVDPIPANLMGNHTLVSAANQHKQVAAPWAKDLLAFLEKAKTMGINRSRWLDPDKKRIKLKTGTRITRGVYDTMLSKMQEFHWVEYDGNKFDWRDDMDADTAIERLRAEIERIEDI